MLVVVRSYTNVHEAHLAKSVLEARGIEAFIANEHLVSMVWTYSNAIGGVKVVVPEERADEATQILQSGADPLEGPFALGPRPADEASDACRRCGASAFASRPRGLWFAILSWLMVGIPVSSARRRRYCGACGAPDDGRQSD
jgi:ribosomal protein L37E